MQENCRVELSIGKNGKSKGLGFATILVHVKKELIKLHETEFQNKKIIIHEATPTRTKSQDKQIELQSRKLAENNFSEIDVFMRLNTIPGEKSYAGTVTSHNTKNRTTKQVIVVVDNVIRGIKVRDCNQHEKNGSTKFKVFLVVIKGKCCITLSQR